MNTQEAWKPVLGYENLYEISNLGRVKSLSRMRSGNGKKLFQANERILKSSLVGKYRNYKSVILSINGKTNSFKIHILVAKHFVPNPDKKPEVNHNDGNTRNNFYENLKWCTSKENINHAWENKLAKPNSKDHYKKLGCINRINNSCKVMRLGDGKVFDSLTVACRESNFSQASISRHINNRTKNKLWKKV